jgi:hypothetical protein
MTRSSRPRKTANLSDSVHHQLNMYALAASAASVGMLALAKPAQARIIYTHAHQEVGRGLTLDLNHDGIADFKIEKAYYGHFAWLVAASLGSNRVWGGAKPFQAAELPAGYPVGWNRTKFHVGGSIIATTTIRPEKSLYACSVDSGGISCNGPWSKATSGYLGLKFFITGKIHYGWARLSYSPKLPGTWFLEGYAYETIPKKPIITGKKKGPNEIDLGIEQRNPASLAPPSLNPATLGLLATGSPGLSIWRREELLEARR